MNKALLHKWLWRVGVEKEAAWRKLIASNYGVYDRDWMSETPNGSYGRDLWKANAEGFGDFNDGVSFKVGKGTVVCFSLDAWCSSSHYDDFHEIFRLSRCREELIFPYMWWVDDKVCWDLHLRRPLNNWELGSFCVLLSQFESVHLGNRGNEDLRCWNFDPGGVFSVESCYKCLKKLGAEAFTSRIVWKTKQPSKASFLLWLVYWGSMLTVDNLMRRGDSIW